MTLITNKFHLRRAKMLEFLGEIEGTAGAGSVSVYLPPGQTAPEITDLLRHHVAPPVTDELARLAASAKNGAVLFWGEARKCLVLPPFPIAGPVTFGGYVAGPLHQLLTRDFTIGLVLVHLGSYAVGMCRGEKLLSSKVGTGLVHGRHKKGGSSQQRFQRRRQNQATEFLDRVCRHAREHLETHAARIDYLVYGGPHQTVLLLQKRCPFLQSFEGRVLPSLEVPEIRQRVLETAVGRVWSSGIIEWREA